MDDAPRRRRRPRTGDQEKRPGTADSVAEPLGKLIHAYQVNLASVLVVCGGLMLIGLAVVGYALLQRPLWLIVLLIGAAIVLVAFVQLGTTVLNVGRRLELRKRGVRFVESGVATEI